jgi:hypothetical protein
MDGYINIKFNVSDRNGKEISRHWKRHISNTLSTEQIFGIINEDLSFGFFTTATKSSSKVHLIDA